MTYDLNRSPDPETNRFVVESGKHVYVYRARGAAWWEVFKFRKTDVEEARADGISGDDLLVTESPAYTVLDGACSCPGYGFHRRMCKHLDAIAEQT